MSQSVDMTPSVSIGGTSPGACEGKPMSTTTWIKKRGAMAHQPLHVLAGIDADPSGAWRRGDPDVVDRLARLELRSVGLRPPAGLTSSGRVGP